MHFSFFIVLHAACHQWGDVSFFLKPLSQVRLYWGIAISCNVLYNVPMKLNDIIGTWEIARLTGLSQRQVRRIRGKIPGRVEERGRRNFKWELARAKPWIAGHQVDPLERGRPGRKSKAANKRLSAVLEAVNKAADAGEASYILEAIQELIDTLPAKIRGLRRSQHRGKLWRVLRALHNTSGRCCNVLLRGMDRRWLNNSAR
jgi:hypothetical protein